MKEIDFPQWPERLAQASLSTQQKRSFAITVRWYLSFCRRSRGGVNVQSARDFIDWAEQEKRPEPWKLEHWREALRWFFRAAKAEQAGCAAEGKDQALGASPVPERVVAAESAPGAASAMRPPGWKAAFVATVRRRHYSYRTEQSYRVWLEQFARFCRTDDLGPRNAEDLKAFLDALAAERRVSASSQRQALNAVVFLLREVYGKDLGDFSDYRRAKVRSHAPAWLTRAETQALLAQLEERWALMARVALGGGLRLTELLRLRVKDVDLEQEIITVRGGKGNRDRFVPLAHVAVEPLQAHLRGHLALNWGPLRQSPSIDPARKSANSPRHANATSPLKTEQLNTF